MASLEFVATAFKATVELKVLILVKYIFYSFLGFHVDELGSKLIIS